MIELRPEVKEIIEKHITLIEEEDWDTLFEKIQEEWIPQTTGKFAETLLSCGIDPLKTLTFIPEGYFILSQITSYKVPSNITRICYKAFYASDLENILVTSNVYEIDEQAFCSCDYLTTFYAEEGLKYLNNQAFFSCEDLTNVTLPKSLKRIGHSVFNGCSNLTEITYRGTIADWNRVVNRELVNEGGYVSKIICSDGELIL